MEGLKMKHFKGAVAAALITAMVGSLSACGKGTESTTTGTTAVNITTEEESQKESTTEKTESTTEATTEASTEAAAGDTIWELKDLDTDSLIPDHSVTDATSVEGKEIKLFGAELCNPKDETMESLKSNEWLNSLGVKVDYYNEGGKSENTKAQTIGWHYTYKEGYGIFKPGESPVDLGVAANRIFEVDYVYDTRQFNGEQCIMTRFYDVDMTDPKVQEECQAIVKEIYGEELGELVLYAKEPDADAFAEKPNYMKIQADYAEGSFMASRNLQERELTINVSITNKADNTGGYTAGHEPNFEHFQGTVAATFGGDIGIETFNDNNFADKLCAAAGFPDAEYYGMEYDLNAYICEDGREFDDIMYKYSRLGDNLVWNQYTASFMGDEKVSHGIKQMIVDSGRNGKSKEENLNMINASLSKMFGQNLSVSMSELDNQGCGTVSLNIEIDGEKKPFKIKVDCGKGVYWKIGK